MKPSHAAAGGPMNRRTFLRATGAALLGAGLGCGKEGGPAGPGEAAKRGELLAVPHAPGPDLFAAGEHVLDLGLRRDPLLYLPAGHDASTPAPLAVCYHGAGGDAEVWSAAAYEHADRLGIVLLMMQSRGGTWDLAQTGKWGHDVEATDRALEAVFAGCAIDAAGICLCGFSDGASYALSLGLSNGGLVRHVIAFSPGFEEGSRTEPKPRVFISHGTQDQILPIQFTSRVIVPRLRDAGYDVDYLEFAGGHGAPADIRRAAFDWLVPPG